MPKILKQNNSTIFFLMRNLLVIACAFSAGLLLGSNPSQQKKESLEPIVNNESLYEEKLVIESNSRDESSIQRMLSDFPLYDNDYFVSISISPVIGDDGVIYDDDLSNLEDILESLEEFQTTNKEEIIDDLIEQEDFTSVSDEAIDEPEALLNEVEDLEPLDYERKLGDQHFHTPDPACTEEIEEVVCTTSFRELVENSDENEVLVIPCGECIVVDYDDQSEIILPNGLSIEGKLYLPSTTSITLRTKFVWVSGILEVRRHDKFIYSAIPITKIVSYISHLPFFHLD